MSYLSTNTSRKKKEADLPKFIFSVFLCVVITLVVLYPFQGAIKAASLQAKSLLVSTPLVAIFYKNADLYKENQALLAKTAELSAEVADRNLLASKLDQYASSSDALGGIQAEVIKNPGSPVYDVLTVRVGAAKGVQQGDAAYAGSYEIGSVSKVYGNAADVTLFSSPGTKIDAELYPEGFSTALTGLGGGNFEAEVPKGTSVAVGDIVEDSERGLVYGTVESITGSEQDTFKTLFIAAPANLFQLTWIKILTK